MMCHGWLGPLRVRRGRGRARRRFRRLGDEADWVRLPREVGARPGARRERRAAGAVDHLPDVDFEHRLWHPVCSDTNGGCEDYSLSTMVWRAGSGEAVEEPPTADS
jgi:hypothetical protein